MEISNKVCNNSLLNGGFVISRVQNQNRLLLRNKFPSNGENIKCQQTKLKMGDAKSENETEYFITNSQGNLRHENGDKHFIINAKEDDSNSLPPQIQVTDENLNTKPVQSQTCLNRQTGVEEPESSVEEKDDIPVLDLCECRPNSTTVSPQALCFFCTYNQKRGRLTERRTSLDLPGSLPNGIRDRTRRASLQPNLRLDKYSPSKSPKLPIDTSRRASFSLPMPPDDSRHSPANSRRGSVHSSIIIEKPGEEKMSTPVMIFCKHRLQKLSLSIPCSIGITILILGTRPKIFTFLNYFALLTVLVFYPIFGLLDTAVIFLKKRYNLCPNKPKEDNPPPSPISPGHIDNPPDLIIPYRRPRSASIISRVSSIGTLPSITEEENEPGSNSRGKSDLPKEQGEKYSPCEECLKESRLGICSHPKVPNHSVVIVD